MIENSEVYLEHTYFLDYNDKFIKNRVDILTKDIKYDKLEQKAVKLFYFVRDQIKYEIIFGLFNKKSMKSSNILKKRSGFCISKALLLASMGRAAIINYKFKLLFIYIGNDNCINNRNIH